MAYSTSSTIAHLPTNATKSFTTEGWSRRKLKRVQMDGVSSMHDARAAQRNRTETMVYVAVRKSVADRYGLRYQESAES